MVTLHQDSETQSKPAYSRGQYWGEIGLLIGKLKSPFCLPLELQIHQGRAQIEEDTPAEKPCATLGKRLVTMGSGMVSAPSTAERSCVGCLFCLKERL